AARTEAGSWTVPQQLSGGGNLEPGISVTVDATGQLIALWREDGLVQGRRWDAALPAPDAAGVLGIGDRPKVILDDQGIAMAVWRQRGDGLGAGQMRAARLEPGFQWTSAVAEVLSGLDVIHLDLAVDGSGAALAAWVEGDSDSNTLHASLFQPQ